jgi:membrane protease YdiL (CAAX protease family)
MLVRFFVIAFALCWLITVPIALQVQGVTPQMLPPVLQWAIGFAPLIAAVWVTGGSDERTAWLAAATRLRVPAMWYVIAVLLPWIALAGAFGLRILLGKEPPHLAANATTPFFGLVWLVLAWGEEAGWRAFALPRMIRGRGFWIAATTLGVLWCVWHYPKLYASPYLHFDAMSLKGIAQFSSQIVIANYLLCWLFLRTGSAVVTSVFHASFNLVATVHALAAIDPTLTIVMALVTAGVLVADRAALRNADANVSR